MQRYVVLEKAVGETPLSCLERYRAEHPALAGVPMAYAGRLDPMASGKLLVLIGEECKRQQAYHGLDKAYRVEVLFGVRSDSGDVLGLVEEAGAPEVSEANLRRALRTFTGSITLPYPAFSAKPVEGKPLHTWAIEGRLKEIDIPTYTATVHQLKLISLTSTTRDKIFSKAGAKIETVPPVTELRKALGNDFRRVEVRASWQRFHATGTPDDHFTVATITCTGSAGLYMRTLAEEVAKQLGTVGLAYAIHRTTIGRYRPLPLGFGLWTRRCK